jgi:hypothetical protein
MILNIDTEKESADSLKKIAVFLQSLAHLPTQDDDVGVGVSSDDHSSSFDLFDSDENKDSSDDDDSSVDSFTMIPY